VEILYRSAFALADDIRAGKLSASEVLEYFLARVDRFNPRINAVVALDVDRAREQAQAADNAAMRGENWGPLHGVPLTIKDAFCTEGLVTVGGIPECSDNVPGVNAIAVQRYVDAGAVLFGKTNVPFMSSDLQSFNAVYGTTNNPWDTTRTCGGSSGGAAAALAAGLTPLELGSDIGGSIRTPSHFNGVFGHKPSYGLIPQRGHLPPGEGVLGETDLSVVGPLGTCVADLQRALDVLAGPAPEDACAWRLELPPPAFTDVRGLRVAVWADDDFCPVDAEVSGSVRAAAETLAKLGAKVDERARPRVDPRGNHNNYMQLLLAAMAGGMPDEVYAMARQRVDAGPADDMSDEMLQLRGIALSHRDWLKRNESRLQTRAAWMAFFQDFDVLLCPCAHVVAFPHDHEPDMHKRRLLVNGVERPYTELLGWAGLTLNGYLPVTAVPAGASTLGLPIGMQVVGPFLGDRTTLATAAVLEQHHRGFVAPPGYGD
jgi:amidase